MKRGLAVREYAHYSNPMVFYYYFLIMIG